MMTGIFRAFTYAYRIINVLSIDVAIGACVMAVFIAAMFGVSIPGITLFTLFLSVWIIYTVDHLNDARHIPHSSHTHRHRFHQQHFRELTVAVFTMLLVQFVLLFFLPSSILMKGFVMLGIVIIYFLVLWLFRNNKIYHKELVIAVVYTAGVSLPTFNLLKFAFSFELLIVFLQVCSLAFCNLLSFALLEVKSDKLDSQSSIALSIGLKRTTCFLYCTLGVGILTTLMLFLIADDYFLRMGQLVLLVMFLFSVKILSVPWFRKSERFRYWGDAIFIFPLLYNLWL